MPRSAEAIARRAAKRGIDVATQRKRDAAAARAKYKRKKQSQGSGTEEQNQIRKRRPKKRSKTDDRAWISPKVAAKWKANANPSKELIQRNGELRKQYLADPSGMSQEDKERALVLIQRSERKRKKREKAKARALNSKKKKHENT